MTALFASFWAHVLFGRQNKELGVEDYIYYTQIFDYVYAVAKKGILLLLLLLCLLLQSWFIYLNTSVFL